jgi:hypothetical protein
MVMLEITKSFILSFARKSSQEMAIHRKKYTAAGEKMTARQMLNHHKEYMKIYMREYRLKQLGKAIMGEWSHQRQDLLRSKFLRVDSIWRSIWFLATYRNGESQAVRIFLKRKYHLKEGQKLPYCGPGKGIHVVAYRRG